MYLGKPMLGTCGRVEHLPLFDPSGRELRGLLGLVAACPFSFVAKRYICDVSFASVRGHALLETSTIDEHALRTIRTDTDCMCCAMLCCAVRSHAIESAQDPPAPRKERTKARQSVAVEHPGEWRRPKLRWRKGKGRLHDLVVHGFRVRICVRGYICPLIRQDMRIVVIGAQVRHVQQFKMESHHHQSGRPLLPRLEPVVQTCKSYQIESSDVPPPEMMGYLVAPRTPGKVNKLWASFEQ